MKMTKKITSGKVLIGIFVVLLGFFLWSVWYIYCYPSWNMAAEYEGYEDEFNIVKEYILEQYPNEEDKIVWVECDKVNDIHYLKDVDTLSILECDNDVEGALRTLTDEAFYYTRSLEIIRINGNRISFVIDSGYYAMVYSPDGKPTVVSGLEKDDTEVYVKKADDDWYHVRAK